MKSLGRARGFGAPLWWMTPPSTEVDRIAQEARRAVRWCHDGNARDPVLARQPWLRKVSAEFSRRLAAAHIFVEE